ncbi:hypothetical protein [Halococcoides cellulosivorans]|uniref:Big-1 domain-containing protein n=1 Tax=Halococcoides cellulosivorans TaxID=1679096 RepID=A0A2R4X0V6_9EURY|nr:hypothetical protein [Halococcoides cellulosivorans]AWB27430.1 hypothetical protein HARCEL1_06790 [Halococcoides cellulosivorans]
MDSLGDTRGQSTQIGALLLFAILVVALAGYQASAVPAQNAAAEFEHSERVRGDLLGVHNAVVSVSEGDSESVLVELGLRYTPRLFAVNPGPVTGTLQVDDGPPWNRSLVIDNASASGETGDYWDGSARAFDTSAIRYRAAYNEHTGAGELIAENTALYAQFDERRVSTTGQALIDGRVVGPRVVQGSFREDGTRATSVPIRAISADGTVVPVRGQGGPVTVTVPTRRSAAEWRDLLDEDGQLADDSGGYVERVAPGERPETVQIQLAAGETYLLDSALVGVGSVGQRPEAAYLTSDAAPVVPEGTSTRVTLTVRDAFDSGVSGDTVRAAARRADASVTPRESTSDAAGAVVVTYTAPANISGTQTTDYVDASLDVDPTDGVDGTTARNVSIPVLVRSGGPSGDGSGSTTESNPVAFHDGDGTTEPNEDPTLPPNDPVGDIANFVGLTTTSGSATLSEAETGQGASRQYDLRVGVDTDGVPQGTHMVRVTYSYDRGADAEAFGLTAVRPDGTEISGTRYDLPVTDGTRTETFDLDPTTDSVIDDSGRLVLRIDDTQGQGDRTQDVVTIDRLVVLTD